MTRCELHPLSRPHGHCQRCGTAVYDGEAHDCPRAWEPTEGELRAQARVGVAQARAALRGEQVDPSSRGPA